ncbi:FadR/GntR family transcriptional regulator [Streptomyces sp. NPDC002845]
MGAPLIETAIARLRDLILEGVLKPGDRLPREQDLCTQLGLSRNTVREAVRALVTARVLDVRRGDGTYVTDLTPELLLGGIGFVVELMRSDSALELMEARRVLEPEITGLAAQRASDEQLAEITGHLNAMNAAATHEEMVTHDTEFHAAVARASGNTALASILIGISSGTFRARVWRGVVDCGAHARTIAEHEAILDAIRAGDAPLARAAALTHVATTGNWLAAILEREAALASENTSTLRGA